MNLAGLPWYNGTMKKPDMPLPVHNASKFSWDADRKGAAEASDFGPLGTAWYGQVWSDACDEGFMLHSDRTGADKLFTLVDTERREGDVVKWLFASEDGFTATVFND